jgi:hypothetical protein
LEFLAVFLCRDPWRFSGNLGVSMQIDMRFDGPEYDKAADQLRLTGQFRRIFLLMADANWRTLQEIADATGDPEASVSAQLRHAKKKRFGSHTVNRRARGDRSSGLFEYQLIFNGR